MKTQELSDRIRDIQKFFQELQVAYAKAFEHRDLVALVETSGELYAAYAAIGNTPLARKWASEYQQNLYDARSGRDKS
jgi:hypothetical protein